LMRLYKEGKAKQEATSKLNRFFKKPLMAIFKYPLVCTGKYITAKMSYSFDYVLNQCITVMFYIALIGIINGTFFSESFVAGLVAPFLWSGSFVLKMIRSCMAGKEAVKNMHWLPAFYARLGWWIWDLEKRSIGFLKEKAVAWVAS